MEVTVNSSSAVNEVREVSMNSSVVLHDKDHQETLNESSKENEIKEIISSDTLPDDKKPCIGMAFKTYDEVSNFYKKYALRVGFGVTVKKSWFSKSGECRRLILVCSRGGSGRTDACYQARLTAKTNCQAMIGVRMWDDGLLHIVEANLEHNHPVSPSTAQSLRCYQKMVCKMNLMHASGNRNSLLVEKGCGSITQIGKLKLAEGDDSAIHQFFARMQSKNPNFFYSVSLDHNGRLKNLFWADARSRAASQYFGDVVSLDSTCLMEKYDLPLVAFIGMNHHGQAVLLGCGLLSDETFETYVWLFKTWLTCIIGSQPIAFITDHCKSIQNAVVEVFPGTRHRFCLYCILKKVPEKLKGHAELMGIRKSLKKMIYDSLRADEFEDNWKEMINEYGLEGNEWLGALYKDRHFWIPVFLKDMFWAGLSVVQRGESLNSYFDGFVNPKTTIKQFLSKYETIIQSKCKREAQADSESLHKAPLIASKYYMEEQLSKLYTLNMFKKFQEELKATMYCDASPFKIDGPVDIFEVKECSYMENGKRTESRDLEVSFNNEELVVHCACGLFQFNGILCRHSLSVFKLKQVFEIPSHCILDRWKKDFKRLHRLARYSDDIAPNNQMERYEHLSVRLLHLVEVAFVSEERYQLALKLISELEKSLLDDPENRDRQPRLLSFDTQTSQCVNDLLSSQFGPLKGNQSPSMHGKRRGRPPKKVKESNIHTFVQTNEEQDFLRSSLIRNENLILQAASTPSNLDSHVGLGSQGGIDLMEADNGNELSFISPFGMHVDHQHHLGGQVGLQPSSLFQTKVQFEPQSLQHPTRMQWLYPQNYLEEASAARRTG